MQYHGKIEHELDLVHKKYVDTALELKQDINLVYTNITVATTDWAEDSTYAGYPYKASIATVGVTTSMIPFVNFDFTTTSGIDGIECDTGRGYVYLYIAKIPENDLIIDNILVVQTTNANIRTIRKR